MDFSQKILILCGHYGSGKTNLAINLARELAGTGEPVTLLDLDVVNPYFRSSDYMDVLEQAGVRVMAPNFAGTTLDVPSLPPEMLTVFSNREGYILLDVGGDDAGAAALGRLSRQILGADPYQMLYVINQNRKLIGDANSAVALLGAIEGAGRLRATGIINNTHLAHLTQEADILSSIPYAQKVAELSALPLVCSTCPRPLYNSLTHRIENLLPIDIFVKPPWES